MIPLAELLWISKQSYDASEIFKEGDEAALGRQKYVFVLEMQLKRSYQEIKRAIWHFEYRDIEEIKDKNDS